MEWSQNHFLEVGIWKPHAVLSLPSPSPRLKLTVCLMKGKLIDEDIGIRGKAHMEQRDERAHLCAAIRLLPRNGKETGGIRRKAVQEELLSQLISGTI